MTGTLIKIEKLTSKNNRPFAVLWFSVSGCSIPVGKMVVFADFERYVVGHSYEFKIDVNSRVEFILSVGRDLGGAR